MARGRGSQRLTIDAWQARRRRRRRLGVLAVAAAVTSVAIAGRLGGVTWSSDPLRVYDGRSFAVLRVIDGDTLDIDRPDGAQPHPRVRLWGIDTPELARVAAGRPAEPGAEAARAALSRWTASGRVTLRLEPQRLRDGFGRLLAHVDTAEVGSVQQALLRAGLARADERWHHTRLGTYRHAESEAKADGIGVWGD